MTSAVILDVSNGIIAIITGLVLYGVNRMLRWARDVDERLDAIEKKLDDGTGTIKNRNSQ